MKLMKRSSGVPVVVFVAAMVPWVAVGTESALAPEVVPEPVVVEEVAPDDRLHQAVTETVEVLDRYGLSIEEATSRPAIVEAVAQLSDPAARLLGEEDHRRMADVAEGVAYDTGIRFTQSNRYAVVVSVVEGSAAAEAGIEPGDRIVRVGDADTVDLNVAEIQSRLRATEPGQVPVAIERGGDERTTHTLDQRRMGLEAVEETLRLPAGLGYARVNGLFPGSGDRVTSLLKEWKDAGVTGVVLDLRGADGLDLKSAVQIASMMAKPNTHLFSLRDAADQDLEVHRAAAGVTLGVPLMILTDGQTRGAAELLAATMSGSGHGAMLIGGLTAGDPMIRETVGMSDGSKLYLATRRLVVGSGKVYGGTERVRPDIVVSPSARYPDFDPAAPLLTDRRGVTDEELETHELRMYINGDVPLTRAVDVLLGLKALNLHSFDYGGSTLP